MSPTLLDVRNLRVSFGRARQLEVLHGIDFSVRPGEVFAIVGESGSGKSVTAMSLLGLLPKTLAQVTAGSALFEGEDLLALSAERLRQVRGRRIAMIFQEPMTSLNPVLTIERQMTEGPVAHGLASAGEARRQALDMLEQVGMADAPRRLRQYPHEFSGGMRQRVMIAMAMMMRPALVVADEPTTALDVTIQAQILDLMRSIAVRTGTSMILITHDMGVVAEMADRVLVMRNGHVVENAGTSELFSRPQHAYTRSLLDSVPRIHGTPIPASLPSKPGIVLDVQNVSKAFPGRAGDGAKTQALDNVSLTLGQGETLGLVGESGSGKSTLGRAISRLIDIDAGAVLVDGTDMLSLNGRELRKARSHIQMIFQDPYSSLDPRFSVGRTVAEPIIIQSRARRREAFDKAVHLLEQVGLSSDMARRYPHQFSGGQRQRVAIARALAAGPKIIVADEPTSALDVSIQAQVLDLLLRLQKELHLSLLFISHDLAVVRKVSNRIAVMRAGRILEMGPTAAVLDDPQHIYTRALISAAPSIDPAQRNRKRIAVPARGYPTGPLIHLSNEHWIAS